MTHPLLPHAPCCRCGFLPAELSLGLFCLPLQSWHVGEREGEGGEEREEGRGGGLAQRRCPVSFIDHNKHKSDWEKGAQGRSPFAPACPPRSVSASLRAPSSIQRPACNHVCVRLADTRGRTLRWVLVVHGPGRCFAVISWHLLIRLLQPRRRWFSLTCSYETDKIFIKAVLCVHRSI